MCLSRKQPNHPSVTEQSTPKQFPASNVARFDGLHRDQANAEKQMVDVAKRDLEGKDHKFRRT